VTGAVQAAAIRRRIRIPLRFADDYSTTATVVSFTGLTDAQQHVALELGRPAAAGLPLVRLHSECLTGDVFGSQRCDCGPQLREAVERITKHGGYVLYLRQEGRGIGLYQPHRAAEQQPGQERSAGSPGHHDRQAGPHRAAPYRDQRRLPGH
jgi:GTP cyclohydrolase II